MNLEDYNEYYIQGSDHYLIPKDEFKELFNEMINWKEESQRQKEVIDRKKYLLKEQATELKELINKAYEMGNDSKISLYLRIMDILDYYDENITIERKLQIKKEYGIGDD